LEPTTLDASAERAALQRAFAAVPQAFGVAWVEGKGGRLIRPVVLTADGLRAELRAALGVNAPKGDGLALLCAELRAGATRRTRADIIAPSCLVVDHDKGGRTLGEALELCESMGLAVVAAFPTASERAGWRAAKRWRLLIPLVCEVSPQVFGRGVGARLLRALEKALECRLDLSCANPERLSFVHPRPGIARIPEIDLRHLDGSALDVAEFMRAVGWRSDEGRWWADAARARLVGGCGPEVLSLLRDAGLAPRAPDGRGYAGVRCPRECWHSSPGGPTSTAVHIDSGALLCMHAHDGAPEGQRGTAGTARFLRWVAADHPELAARAASVRDKGLASTLRDELTRPPFGEASRRVVSLAAVGDEVRDAMESAARRGIATLLTPTVGGGKTHGAADAIVAAVLDVNDAREGSEHTIPSGAVLVRTRADVEAFAAAVAPIAERAGVGVGVLTPAHLIEWADGSRVCIYPELLERVYAAGGSARASVCGGGVPLPGGSARGKCPNYDGCPARSNVIPWVSRGGAPGVEAVGEVLPLRWLAVGTHAAAGRLNPRKGSPLIVDESDGALAPQSGRLGVVELAAAAEWAAVVTGRDGSEAPAVGRRMVDALRAEPSALLTLAPELRALHLARALGDAPPRWWGRVRAWVDVAPDAPDADVALAAVGAWAVEAPTLACRSADVPGDGASAAYRTAAAWARGGVATADDDGAALVAWRSDVAELAVRTVRRGGGVLCLDATGDVELTRAALAPTVVEHLPVLVTDGAEVHRTLIASGSAGRRSLCGRRFTDASGVERKGVNWPNAREGLDAIAAALTVSRRRGFGVGPGVLFAPRVLALTLDVLLTGRDVRELAPKAGEGTWAAVREGVASAPEGTAELVRSLGAEVLSHFGGSLARGSNALQHLMWAAWLGDDRKAPSTIRAARAAAGLPTDDASVRTAADSGASRSAEQGFGRLRHVRRAGARLAMVHYGKVPPLGWYELPAPPDVLSPSTVVALAAEPRRVEVLPLRRRAARVADVAPPPTPTSAEVRDAIAAGCSAADVRAITGADRDTVRRWFAGETEPTRPEHLRALRGVTDPRSPQSVKRALRALRDGRGWARVWGPLSRELAGEGLDVAPALRDAVLRWVDVPGVRLPAGTIPALVDVLPRVVLYLNGPAAARALREASAVEAPERADGAA